MRDLPRRPRHPVPSGHPAGTLPLWPAPRVAALAGGSAAPPIPAADAVPAAPCAMAAGADDRSAGAADPSLTDPSLTDPALADERPGSPPPPARNDRSVSDEDGQPPPPRRPGRRLSAGTRELLTILLVASVGGSAAYRALQHGGLERTSALFLGLPMLLGLMTLHLVRTHSVQGRVLQVNVIFLALVSPLLGEASLCILMASPLFLGVSLAVTYVATSCVGRRSSFALLALPLLLGGLESRHAASPRARVTRTVVEGPVEAWREVVRRPVAPAPHRTGLLSLGFPLPLDYRTADDGSLTVNFSPCEGWAGDWRVAARPTADGVRFDLLQDSSKLARWVTILDSTVSVRPLVDGRLELVHSTRYVPRLGPRVWFGVWIDRALAEAHQLAADSWQAALAPD